MRIFVYGTLRRGSRANGLLQGCDFLGDASVEGTLYDIEGRFPALRLQGHTRVRGELWSCSEGVLSKLDQYEGVDQGLFRRTRFKVGEMECWVYVAGPALEPRLGRARVIASGDWSAPAARSG